MKKHLVIKYFDYYCENKYKFKSKADALKFTEEMNEAVRNHPNTWYEYRGGVENE